MRPLLVGESNPYQDPPRPEYDLYPFPSTSAGYRLCAVVLGMTKREYLLRYDRANLLQLGPRDRWSSVLAREAAHRLRAARLPPGAPVGGAEVPVFVLLGYRVASAFGYSGREPFTGEVEGGRLRLVFLPHPSGRCRAWNELGAVERAREVMRRAGAL